MKSSRKGPRADTEVKPGPTALAALAVSAPNDYRREHELSAALATIGDYQCELEAQNRELHLTQRQLSESRDRYFELYENAPASYLTLDERGRIVQANQRLALLLGVARPEFLGRPFSRFLDSEGGDRLYLGLQHFRGGEGRIDLELTVMRADGSMRHVRFDGVASMEAGPSLHCRAVLVDVTDLKNAESHIRALNLELAARIDELTRANRQLAHENQQRIALTGELERGERELRKLSRQVITSQDDERRRLARELHDETGQSLGAIVAELRALEDRHDQPELPPLARQLRDKVSAALRDVRRLAQGLHPAALGSGGLGAALERLVAEQRALHALDLECQLAGFPEGTRLAAPVELTLFRIAQEALTNAIKHAQARHISIVLVAHGQRARLVIEDDGRGFDPEESVPNGSLGLIGMRERVGLVGGELRIESAPERGTTLAVSIPLEP